MRNLNLSQFLLLLGSCAAPLLADGSAGTFFPFADRPTESVTLRHDIQIVDGTVFHFRRDGSRATYHYLPVATILDRNTYVISVSSRLDIADFMSVNFDAEADVLAMITAAETYCDKTGYKRVGTGISIWIGDATSALVEFCVSEGVELPPGYKAGDRVPRK